MDTFCALSPEGGAPHGSPGPPRGAGNATGRRPRYPDRALRWGLDIQDLSFGGQV